MFLHDAIGVGLFVVIAHHAENSVDRTGSCSPVHEYMQMANETLGTMNLSKRSAAASSLFSTAGLFVDGRGKV